MTGPILLRVATDPLLRIAEELYGLAPADFTGTRNQWAKQTKGEGDAELAARLAGLRKPSLSAWVVNMLMRHQADQMTQVLDLGASLRQAQSDLDADALRELTRQRRALTTAVTRQGRTLAGELGHQVTEQVADQVQATLHAAMVDEHAAAAVRSGLLVAALSATGVGSADVVDAVAVPSAIGMTARARSRPAPRSTPRPSLRRADQGERTGLSVVPEADSEQADPELARRERAAEDLARAREERRAQREAERQAQRQAAQDALDQAVENADDARRRMRKARRRAEKVQARILQAAEELDEARRRAAQLEHEQERLDAESTEADERRSRAEERYGEAQDELETARAALDELP